MRRAGWMWISGILSLMAPAVGAVEIGFGPLGLVAGGITPGGQVLVFGVGREPIEWSVKVHRRLELVTDTDGDGRVSLELSEELAGSSVWWVVDLASGATSAAAPAPLEVRPLSAEDEDRSSLLQPSPELAVLHHPRFEVALVRPGAGVWKAKVVDGARADADGTYDGVLRVALLDLEPLLEGQAALTGLEATDLLVGIDPASLEVLSLLPGAPGIAGGGVR